MNQQDNQFSLVNIDAVLFDIVGTLVDSAGTVTKEISEVFDKNGIDKASVQEVADEWSEQKSDYVDSIVNEEKSWMLEDDIRRLTLKNVLKQKEIQLESSDFDQLATVGKRFIAWPEATRQLGELGSLVNTFGLTNSGFAQITEVSTRADFRWHALLSGELAQQYKPHPSVYKFTINILELEPANTLFISTHPWDLRAAAKHGFKTVYLPRETAPNPDSNDQFNLTVGSLDELIAMLKKR